MGWRLIIAIADGEPDFGLGSMFSGGFEVNRPRRVSAGSLENAHVSIPGTRYFNTCIW